MPGVLVVSGVHARLSNIDERGRWIEDEMSTYTDKEVKRVKGESCGRILESWRKLRSKSPEVFEEISVMSEPSAFFDSIITHWRQVEIAKRLGQGVWQRDLSLGALSP